MKVHRPIWLTALSLLLAWPGSGRANPLRVSDFASLGAFPTTAGSYSSNTSGAPTLTGPAGTNITGVVSGGIALRSSAGARWPALAPADIE